VTKYNRLDSWVDVDLDDQPPRFSSCSPVYETAQLYYHSLGVTTTMSALMMSLIAISPTS